MRRNTHVRLAPSGNDFSRFRSDTSGPLGGGSGSATVGCCVLRENKAIAFDRRLYGTGRERAATGRSDSARSRQTSYCEMDEEDAPGVARALSRPMSMASLDKWLTRLAILGAAAA